MTISATTQGIKPGVCTSTNKPAAPFDGQVIYMTDVDQTAVWDGSQWTVLAPIAGGRNKVINGGMSVWQRGTSVSLSASTTIANSYTVDRFQMPTNASQACTVSRQSTSDSTNLPNIQYCARIQRNSGQTGTGNLNPSTSLESVNSISLAGKKVILSFYARAGANYSATSNALGVTVASGTGTDQNIQSGFTGQSTFASGTATLTTSWQRFTYSGTVSNSATQVGMFFTFTPTGTAGVSDYFEITGIQLEEGAVATPFEFEDAQVTLAKCQRYYFRVGGDSGYQRFGYGTFTGTTSARCELFNPVTMRSIPSSIESSTLALYDQSTLFTVTAFTLSTAGSGKNLTQFDATIASGGTTYRPIDIVANASTSAYIGVSAEL